MLKHNDAISHGCFSHIMLAAFILDLMYNIHQVIHYTDRSSREQTQTTIKPKKEDIPLDESDVIRHLRPMECLLFFFLSKCRLRYPFKGIPKSINQGTFAVARSKAKPKRRWKKDKEPWERGCSIIVTSLVDPARFFIFKS